MQAQAAYVLHRRPYRETSAILELFVEQEGRLAVVARGLQRRRAPLSGLCQPLQELEVSWTGRGDLKTLTNVERRGDAVVLQGERLFSMLYCNELLCRLLAQADPHPELYRHYRKLLQQLAGGGPLQALLRAFELALLEEIGYALELDRDADSGDSLDPDGRYRYVTERGLVRTVIADSAPSYHGGTLLKIHAGRFDDAATLRTAKQLLREVLQDLLGPRPLASRELFRRG